MELSVEMLNENAFLSNNSLLLAVVCKLVLCRLDLGEAQREAWKQGWGQWQWR